MKAEIFSLILCTSAVLWAADYQRSSGNRPQPPQLDESTRAAITNCETTTGMPARDSGTRPTREQHEKFRACLKAAGLQMPEHGPGGPRGHGGPPPQDGNDNPPPPPPEDDSSNGSVNSSN